MKFLYTSIGGGITGIETLINIVQNLKKHKFKQRKKKIINLAIIDKKPENIPGGVAYGFHNSQYGFFNNPIRLSPRSFAKWARQKKNKKKIIDYLDKYGGYTGKKWIKNNKKILNKNNNKNFQELYLPRVSANFWMEVKLINLIKVIKRINRNTQLSIKINFFAGEVTDITDNKNYKKITFKNNKCFELGYTINKNSLKKFSFYKTGKILNTINSLSQSIGIGLTPPKQIASKRAQTNKNYIWDFYDEGSTSGLLKKIKEINKSSIKIYFIGYKAGLLESLPELLENILTIKSKIKIYCSSKDLKTIQMAKHSSNKNNYNLIFFSNKNIKKINTAKKLYENIKKELELSNISSHNKYDIWTEILKKKIISHCLKNLSKTEKIKYNNYFHSKIRNSTRFTYPETILAREKLIKKKYLISNKEIVNKVDFIKNKLIVYSEDQLKRKKNYNCDLVVNVSGPMSVKKIKNEIPLLNSLKKKGAQHTSHGFLVNKNFEIKGFKNTFTPGTIAVGFNPERKTIIDAILKNSSIVGKNIYRNIIERNYDR